MTPPIIGIACKLDDENAFVPRPYYEAVEAAGGIPVCLPPLKNTAAAATFLSLVDGLIMTGGGDLDPTWYGEGEARHPKLVNIRLDRDRPELALLRAALDADVPVLGICRGHQAMNVAAGGSLHQDVSLAGARLKHPSSGWTNYHEAALVPGTRVAEIFGGAPRVRVNSAHHQSLNQIPEGWRVAARADDGIVEALESTRHRFALGVQWHPEMMWEQDAAHHGLFRALVAAARRGAHAD